MTTPNVPVANRQQAKSMLDLALVQSDALVKALKAQRNREADDVANLSAENATLKQAYANLNVQLEANKTELESLQRRYDDLRAQLQDAQTKITQLLERKPKKAGSSKPQQQ